MFSQIILLTVEFARKKIVKVVKRNRTPHIKSGGFFCFDFENVVINGIPVLCTK